MRELFVEELAQVSGGGAACPPNCVTTDACCEEGYDLCCLVRDVRDILDHIRP